MAETHKLPGSEYCVSLALFTDVSNAGKLRSEATSGRIKAALLDPTLVSVHKLWVITSCMYELSQSALSQSRRSLIVEFALGRENVRVKRG